MDKNVSPQKCRALDTPRRCASVRFGGHRMTNEWTVTQGLETGN